MFVVQRKKVGNIIQVQCVLVSLEDLPQYSYQSVLDNLVSKSQKMRRIAQIERTRIDLSHKNMDRKEYDRLLNELLEDYLTLHSVAELGVETPFLQLEMVQNSEKKRNDLVLDCLPRILLKAALQLHLLLQE